MLGQIIYGIIGMAIGVVFVVYARKLVENFGTIATAEQKLGYGGTYTVLRILGIFIFVVSLLYMTGFLDYAVIKIAEMLGLR